MKLLCIDAGTNKVKMQFFNQERSISEVSSISTSKAFDLTKGIIFTDIYLKAFNNCLTRSFNLTSNNEISAIGLIGIGPSLVTYNNARIKRIASNYNYQNAPDGVAKTLQLDLYKIRGVGTGPQYTPEQIIQLQIEKKLPQNPFFTTFLSYLCHTLGADINKWTFPEASYNGLIDVKTGNYNKKLFKKFKFSYNWFPKLTSGHVGYLSNQLIHKLKVKATKEIPIYNLGTDGPATQAYFGKKFSTFKIESTGAFRVKGKNPIFDKKPIVKGFPGVWNIFYKESDGEKYFISGSTVNAGVNTIKYYFPKFILDDFQDMDKRLMKLMRSKLPGLDEVGVELPFEYGERDGIKRKFGIIGKQTKDKVLLYYAIKEGVMFNMMQRISLVRKAQQQAGNTLSDKFILTGPILYSKPWIDLALVMLNIIIGIKNPQLVKPRFKEIGLATIAKGIFKKMRVKDNISVTGKTFCLSSLSLDLDSENKKILLRRWNTYKNYYRNSNE